MPRQEVRADLVVYSGSDIGKRYPLEDGEVLIGRVYEAGIRITDEGVSRKHAMLKMEQPFTYVEDLRSTNGTYVNDKKISRTRLTDGDYLRVGQTVFRFVYGGGLEAEFVDDMYRRATTDTLTQTYNKRYLVRHLEAELERTRRHGKPLSLVMLDIDHFKKINDAFGHHAGDAILKELSSITAEILRSNDVFARYGGEEFSIILPETNSVGAGVVCERIRHAIANHQFTHNGKTIPVTVSMGAQTIDATASAMTAGELIEAADSKLYLSKREGRNRVSA